ncbi:MAG TPA: hypothetical protein VIJ38_17355 [Acidobacteriaceae bacterium]
MSILTPTDEAMILMMLAGRGGQGYTPTLHGPRIVQQVFEAWAFVKWRVRAHTAMHEGWRSH